MHEIVFIFLLLRLGYILCLLFNYFGLFDVHE
jgi:hypothetical protein